MIKRLFPHTRAQFMRLYWNLVALMFIGFANVAHWFAEKMFALQSAAERASTKADFWHEQVKARGDD